MRCLVGIGLAAASWRLNETQRLFAVPGSDQAHFGYSMALSETRLAVGAPRTDDANATNSGSVFVYGPGWNLDYVLVAPDAAPGTLFGRSVAVADESVVVGAYSDTGSSAYIFGSNGTFVQKLAEPAAGFGVSVGATQDVVAVGAFLASEVYLYWHNGTAWNDEAVLVGAPASRFGYALSVSGDFLVVGAYLADVAASNSGAVFIYEVDGAFVQQLVDPSGDQHNYFGFSVSISGDLVVVGSWGDNSEDTGFTDAGSASVFRRVTNGGWTFVQHLAKPGGQTNDYFGWSVDVSSVDASSNLLVVGAYEDDAAGTDVGAAYVYGSVDGGATWTLEQQISAAAGNADDRFGAAVAINGDQVVVGAYEGRGNTLGSGVAHAFQLFECSDMVVSGHASYTVRAASGFVVTNSTVAPGETPEQICLDDGCYTLRVDSGDDVTWQFSTLSGTTPYGPTTFVARDGLVVENATCNFPTPVPSSPIPTPLPSLHPTNAAPARKPTMRPTRFPVPSPTALPTASPTIEPTPRPTTYEPSTRLSPTVDPTQHGPTTKPTFESPTSDNTAAPTLGPTLRYSPPSSIADDDDGGEHDNFALISYIVGVSLAIALVCLLRVVWGLARFKNAGKRKFKKATVFNSLHGIELTSRDDDAEDPPATTADDKITAFNKLHTDLECQDDDDDICAETTAINALHVEPREAILPEETKEAGTT